MSLAGAALVNWCDAKNLEGGRKVLGWFQINSEEPDHFVGTKKGFFEHMDVPVGPDIHVGRRYRIIYHSPVRLPFVHPTESDCAFHVAEIEGEICGPPLTLKDVKVVVCVADNHTVRQTIEADKSIFRLFEEDVIQQI